ncbi:predicted protein [Uncinocarpus reesii 1704]|uniref:DUF7719 domain-containing protein n=1 Tax=Uncinocarpus reesii (strain UAMH 1704) TaxID=336963 RepID=C4JR96_UNCRE|nr:uncharacterized protein UREG_04985 [Uncinocarpus reesii 1704]EEP80143.1 predicted protein [Uncinocarpus reesii 1704]
MAPRNRRERRAAAATGSSADSFDPDSIPMARPPTSQFASQKNARTLLEIAAERRAATGKAETEFIHVSPSGQIVGVEKLTDLSGSAGTSAPASESDHDDEAPEDDAVIPPLADSIFLSLPLSALHFTLSFLAAHQYAEEIPLQKLIRNSLFVAFPVLTFLIHFAHGHLVSIRLPNFLDKGPVTGDEIPGSQAATRLFSLKSLFPLTTRNIIFCVMAVASGMHLIATANEGSYYAVMKKTPSIGTLWVWCVLEISLGPAILGLLIPVIWSVGIKGHSII